MTELERVYGEALYQAASEEGLGSEIMSELDVISGVFGSEPEFIKLLSTPSIPKDERCRVVENVLLGRASDYTVSFLRLLVRREAIRDLPGCVRAYRERYYEANGILEVTATTAVPLPAASREKLLARLASVFGKRIILRERVDPSVLGGMRLECAGRLYDGTVKDRLARIERGLRETVL